MSLLTVPSATGGGRVKVALQPGKALIDWVRLSRDEDMAGIHFEVSDEELSRHSSEKDCWILLHEKVYNVTQYLSFHPGGVPELMRAGGTDGTGLFVENHAWVNYESLLRTCCVGRFIGDRSKLRKPGPSTIILPSRSLVNKQNSSLAANNISVSVDEGQGQLCIECKIWQNARSDSIIFDFDCEKKTMRILLRFLRPNLAILWANVPSRFLVLSYSVQVEKTRVIVKFVEPCDLDYFITSTAIVQRLPDLHYRKCTVRNVEKITHDTFLYQMVLPENCSFPVPIGHHVNLRLSKKGNLVFRPYTPLQEDFDYTDSTSNLTFMIKIYHNGIFTPALAEIKIGDTIELSDPIGSIYFDDTIDDPLISLLLLAGGTGITPMVNVIAKRLNGAGRGGVTKLLFFNKTEEDILLSDKFDRLSKTIDQFSVVHILSSASPKWIGSRGRISDSLLGEHLPIFSIDGENQLDKWRIYVCGPDPFVEAAVRILAERGVTSSQLHVFQGNR